MSGWWPGLVSFQRSRLSSPITTISTPTYLNFHFEFLRWKATQPRFECTVQESTIYLTRPWWGRRVLRLTCNKELTTKQSGWLCYFIKRPQEDSTAPTILHYTYYADKTAIHREKNKNSRLSTPCRKIWGTNSHNKQSHCRYWALL